MKKKVLVAMSGGVDSSVAAYLLKEAGYDVIGATIQTWAPKDCDKLNTRACCSIEGVEDARSVADKLGIPYYVFNMEQEFKAAVVDYFTAEYVNGRTPNPCIACNERIKFRLFLRKGLAMGVDAMATGHYADVMKDESTGRFHVTEGLDSHKDQSYVLFALSQEELSRLHLPVGRFRKAEIRKIAEEQGFTVFDKPDSQEICFIPSNDYATFVKKETGLEDRPGKIRTREGKVLGEHRGYFHYTLGQRKGLGIAHAYPLFVTAIDKDKNEVIVGPKEEVRSTTFVVSKVNWMMDPGTETEWNFDVKIRSAHKKSPARVVRDGHDVRVTFDIPQDAITPGQAAVFYDGGRVMAGGWIDSVVS